MEVQEPKIEKEMSREEIMQALSEYLTWLGASAGDSDTEHDEGYLSAIQSAEAEIKRLIPELK